MTALLKPLYGYIAAGALAVLVLVFWWGDHNGSSRVQGRYDAFVAEVTAKANAEQARQEAEAAKAQAQLQADLDAALAAGEADRDAVAQLQAWLLSAPVVAGRGATARDVELLNAR